VSNGKLAVREIEKNMPALLILDISMPEMDGIEVTKYLRSIGTDIPICVLSAHDQVSDRVLGLEVGADDYLIKPFAFEELVARVKALLRRQVESSTRPVSVSELSVDPLTRTASYFDMSLDLTKKEFDLLYALAINASIVVTRDQLLDRVWGYDFEVNTNVVDVFVGYLRRKMEVNGSPRMIETVRGVGFVLKK
jgi:two-component system response regulator PrrA